MNFYGLFPVLYYHSTLNDHFVFVVLICYWVLRSSANFHTCLLKEAMSVKQIALACSGPPLSSNVLNASIGRVAYVSTLMSLQHHGQTCPD